MQAVILAAGLGSRLGNLSCGKPKGFLKPPSMSMSLIERSIDLLQKNGIHHIIIGTGHLKEFYEELAFKHNGSITTIFNPHYQTTGSAETLKCVRPFLQSDFLLLESDLLYEEKAIQVLLEDTRKNIILSSGKTHSLDEVFLQVDSNGKLVNLSKDRMQLENADSELVGICKVSLDWLKGVDCNSAQDYEYLLKGFDVLKVEDLVWCEIDCEEHLFRAEKNIIPKLRRQK